MSSRMKRGYQDNFKPVYFFFYEKISDAQKTQNAKQTASTLLEVFARTKNCCLC